MNRDKASVVTLDLDPAPADVTNHRAGPATPDADNGPSLNEPSDPVARVQGLIELAALECHECPPPLFRLGVWSPSQLGGPYVASCTAHIAAATATGLGMNLPDATER